MTTQSIIILISAVGVTCTMITLLSLVLKAVRYDGKQTGAVGEKLSEFATRLMKFETDRDDIVKLNDARIAAALQASNEIIDRRDHDLIEAVKGFRLTVDDLKSEFAAIKNMWAGERRLVEKMTELQTEITRMIERFKALEADLDQLKRDHDINHPRLGSGPHPMHPQDGAPRHPCDIEPTNPEGGVK